MRYAITVAALLLLASCASDGGPVRPPDESDFDGVAKQVLDNTPEHTHWVKGTKFSWCMFISPKDNALPQLTEKVLARLRKKYTVYLTEDEIPAASKMFRNGEMVGFKNGFMFRMEIEPLGATRLRIHYSDWETQLAASTFSVTYEWTGRSWKSAGRDRMTVSRVSVSRGAADYNI